MTFPHVLLVCEVNHPALLDGLGPDPLGLLDTLDQPLNGNIGLGRTGVGVEGSRGNDGGAANLWNIKLLLRIELARFM